MTGAHDKTRIRTSTAHHIGVQVKAQTWPEAATVDDILIFKIIYAVDLCNEIGFAIPPEAQFSATAADMHTVHSVETWVKLHATRAPAWAKQDRRQPMRSAREMLEEIDALHSLNVELLAREGRMLRIVKLAHEMIHKNQTELELDARALRTELINQGYIELNPPAG